MNVFDMEIVLHYNFFGNSDYYWIFKLWYTTSDDGEKKMSGQIL